MEQLIFTNRNDFREWLKTNSEASGGVWLVFGKTSEIKTLTANDALEEALCFGWIDGQMKSVDNTKYLKYFAKRRLKSVWSTKNKKTVEILRENGLMTQQGEKAVEEARKNGLWNDFAQNLTAEQIDEFASRLTSNTTAFENFNKMPPSGRLAVVRRYYSVKSEILRQRNLAQIITLLSHHADTRKI